MYERCKAHNLPLLAGGLNDQPHIWLIIWETVESTVLMYKSMEFQAGIASDLMQPMNFGK